jgi:uncharacterized protein YkwD
MKTRRNALLLTLALAGGLFALPQGAHAQAAAGRAVNPSDIVGAVNAYRRANGLPAVRADASVMNAARAHARAMAGANSLSHDLGGDLRSRLASHGVGRTTAVENVAWGVNTVQEVMSLWQGSAGHNQNLLAPDISRLGIGAAAGPTGMYWALIMTGTPRR